MELVKEYIERPKVSNAQQVYLECEDIKGKDKEFLCVFFLDTKNKIIAREIISIGTLNSSLVHSREIFKPAILRSANSIILAHNHPSGDAAPSKEDLSVTNQIYDAGTIIGIELIDHVIITETGYESIIDRAKREKWQNTTMIKKR